MTKKKIDARIIADSLGPHGNRITTFVLTYPRIIHAELLTHRLFSRNAASSRAIPALKMIKDIEEDPFIPVAWQKDHKGMQGTEYFGSSDKIRISVKDNLHIETTKLLEEEWLQARDYAISQARNLLDLNCTKQLINRILEPYQWYTSIVTATEYSNFFALRCPLYHYEPENLVFKSKKDWKKKWEECFGNKIFDKSSDLDFLEINKGLGEIHIALLAEAMWDAMNESKPKQLKAGDWHIPFGDGLVADVTRFSKDKSEQARLLGKDLTSEFIKIATARCARVSYLNFEGKDDYEADIKLYDRLLKSGHMSPFEHCARAMSEDEFHTYGHSAPIYENGKLIIGMGNNDPGWSGNFRGFVQLRQEIEQ